MEVDYKKNDLNNDDISIDVKTTVESSVIPTKEFTDIKPDTHVIIPEYDVTITNTEVSVSYSIYS